MAMGLEMGWRQKHELGMNGTHLKAPYDKL